MFQLQTTYRNAEIFQYISLNIEILEKPWKSIKVTPFHSQQATYLYDFLSCLKFSAKLGHFQLKTAVYQPFDCFIIGLVASFFFVCLCMQLHVPLLAQPDCQIFHSSITIMQCQLVQLARYQVGTYTYSQLANQTKLNNPHLIKETPLPPMQSSRVKYHRITSTCKIKSSFNSMKLTC